MLGRTRLSVSQLGFGCGSVGGLMVRGDAAEQERAVAHALALGVTYFDTAPMYGDGRSEENLGRVLARLRPEIVVATKVRVDPGGAPIGAQVAASLDASLRRLRRERVDVLQLHTPVSLAGADGTLALRTVLDEVVPAFEAQRRAGRIGWYGFSGTGEAAALPQLVGSGAFDVAQVIYNLLNASAGSDGLPFLGPDYEQLLAQVEAQRMGAAAIRVLAAGALSGASRHPTAVPAVDPMGTGPDFSADVAQAQRLLPLVTEGHVGDLVEAALRFAAGQPAISTVLVGFSDVAQVAHAAAAIERGPLAAATLRRIEELLAVSAPRRA